MPGLCFLGRVRVQCSLNNKSDAAMLHRTFYIPEWLSAFGCWALTLRGLHAQLVADELEGRSDGLVHVVVLVATQATGEDHITLLRRQLLVLLVEGLILASLMG